MSGPASTPMVNLGELMPRRIPTINPASSPDEEFELWSIPAFDSGAPERLLGRDIGSPKKAVEPDDVLLSRIVPHIRRSWVVGPRDGARQIASSEWITFRSDHVWPDYLRHYLVSDGFHAQFMNTVAGVGGSLLRARPEAVKEITLPLPPLGEQKRIAATLDQADTLRRLHRRALDRLTTLGQSIFNEMFGGLRSKNELSGSSLGDIADILIGYPFKSDKYIDAEGGIKLCRGANVLPGQIEWSDTARYPASEIERLGRYNLLVGDTVVAMDRPWISSGFKVAQICEKDVPSLLVQRVARIRAKTLSDQAFIYFLVSSSEFQKHCRPTETTVPHISPKDFQTFRFELPSTSKRERFGQIFIELLSLKEVASQGCSRAESNFKTLQSRAFLGDL